ncbi:MAG: hypothetical protein FJZ57_04615 [Chlamydiae bacterium]|nr:hypothetical protein [Chlamydiota bacterium]
MTKQSELKRLFIAWECSTSYSETFPRGRSIYPLHLTLAFLGDCKLTPALASPEFFQSALGKIAPCGLAKKLLFLPENISRVVALKIENLPPYFFEGRQIIVQWLQENGFSIDKRPFYPHVSLSRNPFDKEEWIQWFKETTVICKNLHLYESVGNLVYEPLWSIPFTPPYEEIEHTADFGFLIRGYDLKELLSNAQIALATKFPELIPYITPSEPIDLNQVKLFLNKMISKVDEEIGSPIKAISYHGTLEKKTDFLEWEMIIDV